MENPQLDPVIAQRTATLIGLSLALGVTMFAAVAWWSHQQGTAPQGPARRLPIRWFTHGSISVIP
jgi:hypothetical protein